MAKIVVVEDEVELAGAIAARLRSDGHVVDVAADGPSAVRLVAVARPDAVVLDLMLPGFDGLEVCRQIQRDRPVPVIMLTARGSETDLVVGLEVGADDYLCKPFSMRELTARVRALLRRVDRSAHDP
ncbi:MAG TPA: response regulator transcription factor, partial [Streptosporangiaceae bacterium]